MAHPKLLVLIAATMILLGYGASSPDRAVDVAFKAPAQVLEYGHRMVMLVQAARSERRAAEGDPCALLMSAYHHMPNSYVKPLTRNGANRNHTATWYTGIEPDVAMARERLQASIDAGGCAEQPYPTWMEDRLLRDDGDAVLLDAVDQLALPSATAEEALHAMSLFNPETDRIMAGPTAGMTIFFRSIEIAARVCDKELYAEAFRFIDTLPDLPTTQRHVFLDDAPNRLPACTG